MKKGLAHLLVATVACIAVSGAAHATYVTVPGDSNYRTRTASLMDMRFKNIMRQKFDFSCGSAALASLMTYHYNRPVSEKTIIDAMYKNGDKAKIRREGFSLLDMKNYLQSVGLRANGYREPLDRLVQVGIPAIVLINKKGYMHFVLIQGVSKDKVLLGDPAQGRKVISRREFESMWQNKILFVVDDDLKRGRSTFNTAWHWGGRDTRGFTVPMPNANLAAATLFTSYQPNTYNR